MRIDFEVGLIDMLLRMERSIDTQIKMKNTIYGYLRILPY